MLKYQDYEKTKRELLEAQAEYLKKKNDLKAEKEQIIWNIEIFERMYGETDIFNEIKKINQDDKVKQYIQSQKHKREYNTIAVLLIIFSLIVLIVTYLTNSIMYR